MPRWAAICRPPPVSSGRTASPALFLARPLPRRRHSTAFGGVVPAPSLLPDIQRGDSEREGVPADVRQAVAAQALGEDVPVRELLDARRQIAVGVVLAARDEL